MRIVATPRSQPVHSFVSTLDNLEDSIRKFWTRLEDVPSVTLLSVNNQRCKTLFKETTHRDSSGRLGSSISVCRESTLFC